MESLRTEVKALRSRVPGRLRFTDEERRSLAEAALAMGREAMRAVVSIVKPDTILRWHRKLVEAKWDYSERLRRGPGRPRKPGEVEELVCRLARENAWGCHASCWGTETGTSRCRQTLGLFEHYLETLRLPTMQGRRR